MNLIQTLEKEQVEKLSAGKTIPEFAPGDTVLVNVKVKEGERSRVQAYEGVCIARAGSGLNRNFTVRKVRRAKLYYLRGLRGKKARIAEAQGPADEAAAAQK